MTDTNQDSSAWMPNQHRAINPTGLSSLGLNTDSLEGFYGFDEDEWSKPGKVRGAVQGVLDQSGSMGADGAINQDDGDTRQRDHSLNINGAVKRGYIGNTPYIELDGVDDQIKDGTSNIVDAVEYGANQQITQFTAIMWVNNLGSHNGSTPRIFNWRKNHDYICFLDDTDSGENATWRVADSVPTNYDVTFSFTSSDGWKCLALTYDKNNSQSEFFLDGISQGTASPPDVGSPGFNQTYGSSGGDNYFGGKYAYMTIYSRVLDQTEIKNFYNATKADLQ